MAIFKKKAKSKAKKPASKPRAKKPKQEETLADGAVPKKALGFVNIKGRKSPLLIDRGEYAILVISAEDQALLTEFRNTGKGVGEINYVDQALPGIQGDEVILVLRK